MHRASPESRCWNLDRRYDRCAVFITCVDCFASTGKLRRTRKAGIPYHSFECTSCGKTGDRHQVSARVAALLLKQVIDQNNISTPRTSIESRSSAGFL